MAQSFDDFMLDRKVASDAYISGDAGPLDAILTRHNPASFMGPSGLVIVGSNKSAAAQREGAAGFAEGSTGDFEIIEQGSDGNLGFWTGTQPAKVMLKGKDAPVEMTLRVTEIFRREDGDWKLVHRHADMAKDG